MALVLTPLNGLLPSHMLRVVDGGRGPRGPQRLRLDAADAYDRCLRAGMPSGCLRSGYRDRAEQQAEVDRAKAGKTPVAAAPGRSYHGEGTAADVDEPARSWLHRHGAAHGWRGGLIKSEPWHFVYDPDYDQHRDTPAPTVPEEDTMLLIINDKTGLGALVYPSGRWALVHTTQAATALQAANIPLARVDEGTFAAMTPGHQRLDAQPPA